MIYYVDGSTSSLGNYICITDNKGNILLFKKLKRDRKLSSNETEYEAMIEVLKMAIDKDTIFSDSLLCVSHITGKWKVKQNHLIPYRDEAQKILKTKPNINLLWVERGSNLAGQHLEKFIKTNTSARYRKTVSLRQIHSK